MPTPAEYVALGAPRQAVWALSGRDMAPQWSLDATARYKAAATPAVLERYRTAAQLTLR